MGNINIEIPESVHKKLKIAAALKEKTLKQLIVDSLSEGVGVRRKK